MASPISTRTTVIICLESFNQLAERSEQTYYRREDEVASVSWMDELGRLRVWAANTGALHTGQSSLDFQLEIFHQPWKPVRGSREGAGAPTSVETYWL